MATATLEPPALAETALRHAAEIKRGWRAGGEPDAAAVLEARSDLADVKSVVIDLAYEEYCLREQAGDPPNAEQFCNRFPRYRSSIRKVLDAHRLVAESPGLLDPDPAGWPQERSTFEGLEIVGELGRGSFARAYLAYDPETDRPCVLKLSTGHSGEARVIGSLRHPHITEVYWARRLGRLNAVCMPLVGLSTLEDVRNAAFGEASHKLPLTAAVILDAIEAVDRPADDDRAVSQPVVRATEPYAIGVAAIIVKIADALRYLHERGTSHGDLKPSNVVLGPGGHPFLIDFNLSATGSLPASAVGGTLPYLAPEQLRRMLDAAEPPGDPARADVYAFGVLAYELLTGQPPLMPPATNDSKSAAADLLALISDEARAACAFPPGTPEPLARVIRRCLLPAPAERPGATEVVRDLEACLRAERGERAPRRWLQAALLCGVVALAVGGWLARSEFWPAQVQAEVQEKKPETADEYFDRGLRYLHQNQLPSAMSDFVSASNLKKDAKVLAYMAYCAARMGQQANGVLWGRRAIESGATSAAVYNNLGYSLLKNNEPKAALPYFDWAIQISPGLQAARYNRALAGHHLAIGPDSAGFDARAIADIDAALSSGPVTAQLQYDAALIYMDGIARNPSERMRVLQCLSEAVALGKAPATFAHEHRFAELADNPEFRRILGMTPGTALPPANLRLIEPETP